ncbi:MAG: hypothetical protein QMC23_03475 [Rubritalea sp.]|jgi:hypothetical protein|tara:strand:- start:226 stop:684 length:459 start_codon:yes stop_codon:yes gene_type:complete
MKLITPQKITTLLAAFIFTSCATSYDTKKSFWTGNTGFSETQLGSNVWQIDFTGNTHTNRDTTKKYTLKKAAQIAIREGYPYFIVAEGQTNRDVTGSNYAGGYNGNNNYNGYLGGSSYVNTKTVTTMTIELLSKKVSSKGLVYEANFLNNRP